MSPAPRLRAGIGYDVHRLVEGRRLVLGGIEIPHEKGLAGHSDADVLLHAIADALLGAAGMGDIGEHFPSDDPTWEGADSVVLLRRVVVRVAEAGWTVANVDATLLAEAPKIRPHVDAMRRTIASTLGVAVASVSVKATTSEGMGFVGRGEGMAAMAICALTRTEE
ncbi:MAG: 2-C-methyl-D-erythritol 2,4-cyclodiphosphate synthase [Gemmatimonadetes bacterium]|nr:2-C-methyl-D-erythritol 2,4-cyclodiphosphate synthase [Gemmatimonadota bacterium]